MKNWPDWLIRAAKTFVQAFLGVFLPAIISVLNGGFPIDWGAVKITIASALMAALAAGISAVWNIALEVHSDLKSAGGGNRDR